MSRANTTEYLILGCLSIEPMSGYDIREFVKRTIGNFWQESYGQLYPTLKRLLEKNFVSRKVQHREGVPDRHLYRITNSGREYLRDWLNEETTPTKIRHETLLKIFFGSEAGRDTVMAQIESYINRERETLRKYEEIDKQIESEADNSEAWVCQYATLRYGLYIGRARVRWGKETIERLKKVKDKKSETQS